MPQLVNDTHNGGQGSTKHPPPATPGVGTGLTYGHSKQRGAAGCIQYCPRSSRLAPSRCCKTKTRQGRLRQTPNRDRARAGPAQFSHQGGYVTAVVRGSHREHRGQCVAHTCTWNHSSVSPHPPVFLSELPLPHILQPYTALPKSISEEHVSIRLNHKRQQTIDPLLIHTPQKNSDGSGKLSFSTARVTRGGCKSKTVGYRVCSWSPL